MFSNPLIFTELAMKALPENRQFDFAVPQVYSPRPLENTIIWIRTDFKDHWCLQSFGNCGRARLVADKELTAFDYTGKLEQIASCVVWDIPERRRKCFVFMSAPTKTEHDR